MKNNIINDIAILAESQQGGGLQMLITFALIGVIFYFLMIRPQLKQQKQLKARQESLKSGDKVVTNAGLHGIIREVKDRTVKLELAANVVVTIEKSCVVNNLGKDGAVEQK